MHGLGALIKALGRDNCANVAIITALSALPLIGMMGLATDYALALMTKSKIDSAADAAAVAAITTAQSIIAANNGDTGTALSDGAARGLAVFKANMGSVSFLTETPTSVIPLVTRSGQTLSETVTYTATQQNNFGKLFNAPTTTIRGTAVASVTIAKYLDFYLLLDVSGSMGFPSTSDGARALKKVNMDEITAYPGGCEFACHIDPRQGFKVARDNHIQLRADAVGNAVCQLIQTAKTKTTIPNQYRVGVYPFIVDLEEFSALSSNLGKVMSDVNNGSSSGCSTSTPASAIGNLLDTGDPSSTMGSGGTHFEIALPHMGGSIATVGDGSSSGSPKPFIFLVTDGMQNNQGFKGTSTTTYWWSNGSQPRLMDPSDCDKLKQRSITVAVLNIPYQPIDPPNHSYSNDEDGKANIAVTGNPNIASTLRKCASPNFYFTANSPEDITNAMSQMFAQATLQTRITN